MSATARNSTMTEPSGSRTDLLERTTVTSVLPPRPATATDARGEGARWRGPGHWRAVDRKLLLLLPIALALAVWYFTWLLQPTRVGNPVLYGLLVMAELFNVAQAAGFWWTCRHGRDRPAAPALVARPAVDVLIPVYNEPIDVVEPTVAAAMRLRGADVRVFVLDDAGRAELESLARRRGARYVCRGHNRGAKAGNLNHALALTDAPYVVVFDCDHVPQAEFLEHTMGWLVDDDDVAFVQTPQHYANAGASLVARAAAAQQSLFFGAICRGKDALDAMICCGTNVVFRRRAIEAAGGFPERSLTEDYDLSLRLHELGWRSIYVNEVLANGLGPEDMASYVSQQQRWARGCLAALPLAIEAELPWRVRAQYLFSSLFFLSGWTFALYMALPVIRIFTGAQPLAGTSASLFVLHFAPYFGVSLLAVAVAGGGAYTFDGFALLFANYWVHILATVMALTRRRGRFVVTAKRGQAGRQLGPIAPTLATISVLLAAAAYGMDQAIDAGQINNVAFALLHVSVLTVGIWPALGGRLITDPSVVGNRLELEEVT